MEGAKLSHTQFCVDARFSVMESKNGDGVELIIDENGQFKVSGRNKHNPNKPTKPLIDHSSDVLAEHFEEGQPIRIEIHDNCIKIRVHHMESAIQRREARAFRKIANGLPFDVCSLFHGGGFLDLACHNGFKRSNIATRLALVNEIQPQYLEASLSNNAEMFDKNTMLLEGDISTFSVENNKTEVDGLIAGIPCTGASKGGKSKLSLTHAEDHPDAGVMFYSLLRFIDSMNPFYAILENVPEYRGSASYSIIKGVLKSKGYVVYDRDLEGNEFGCLENRKRMSVVVLSKGLSGFDINKIKPTKQIENSINDILEPIALNSPRYKEMKYLHDKEKRDIKKGNGFTMNIYTGVESSVKTILKGYAKQRSAEPLLQHPMMQHLKRLFTPVEHALMKGIPLKCIRNISDTLAHNLLGQSIIFPAFEDLCASLSLHLKELTRNQLAIAV